MSPNGLQFFRLLDLQLDGLDLGLDRLGRLLRLDTLRTTVDGRFEHFLHTRFKFSISLFSFLSAINTKTHIISHTSSTIWLS